jgi:hypothetical protein
LSVFGEKIDRSIISVFSDSPGTIYDKNGAQEAKTKNFKPYGTVRYLTLF